MTRNFGFTFGRTPEGNRADYAELEKRLAEQNAPIVPVTDPIQPINPTPNQPQPLAVKVQANINLDDYVQIGINGLYGKPVVISKFEIKDANNKNYEDTHKFVLKQGVYIPTPQIFMTHFQNVVKAFKERKNKNGSKLLDGKGNIISGNDLEDLYKHLTKDHIATYGGQAGAWTWLNAGFKNGNLETVMGVNSKGLTKNIVPLDAYLKEDAYVNFDFNSQGLAKANSKCANQAYSQGENIYFWQPREGAVAWFNAGSDRAILSCSWYPTGSDSSLGVFACAEGAVVAKNGGKK